MGNGSRVAHVPLIHPTGTGATQVEIAGFPGMFLIGRQVALADILVEFVAGPTPVGNGSWGRTKIRYR